MLYGHEIIIWTDHKNLTKTDMEFTCQRVLRQRLAIEEFGLIIIYIEGEKIYCGGYLK